MLDAIRSDSEQPGSKDELASDLGMTYVHLRAFRALTQRTARRLLAEYQQPMTRDHYLTHMRGLAGTVSY